MHRSYSRLFLMIGTSLAMMYGLMYLNTYMMEHVKLLIRELE